MDALPVPGETDPGFKPIVMPLPGFAAANETIGMEPSVVVMVIVPGVDLSRLTVREAGPAIVNVPVTVSVKVVVTTELPEVPVTVMV